ncbi:MAG: cell division protein FtsQ/DivIB [Parasporobacterium sp.]|nr:cell division protein FtsQ/DivIB [Parasporobacterium sp.]
MKKKVIIIIISVAAVCIIAACVLYLRGVIRLPWGQSETPEPKAEMYLEYMDEFMLIDSNGVVIGSTSEPPEGIPKINGIDFPTIIVGEKLAPENEEAYAYAKRIVNALKKNSLFMREIYISSDLEASLYINDVCIFLGADNKTEEKLNELRDFIDDFKDLSGTLDMQELSVNNLGYTFKIKQN